MCKLFRIFLIGLASLSGNMAFARQVEPPYDIIRLSQGETVQLEGYLDYRGETIFYTSVDAKRLRLVFPYCISGFSNLTEKEIVSLSSHRLKIDAEVLNVETINGSTGISTDVLVAGNSIKNWCLGNKVLKILSVRRTD